MELFLHVVKHFPCGWTFNDSFVPNRVNSSEFISAQPANWLVLILRHVSSLRVIMKVNPFNTVLKELNMRLMNKIYRSAGEV